MPFLRIYKKNIVLIKIKDFACFSVSFIKMLQGTNIHNSLRTPGRIPPAKVYVDNF